MANNIVLFGLKPAGNTVIMGSGKRAHNCSISPDYKDITVFGIMDGIRYSKKFLIGDYAQYDSTFELIQFGFINKITTGWVNIIDTLNDSTHQLGLYDFANRNWNFDLERIEQFNLNKAF